MSNIKEEILLVGSGLNTDDFSAFLKDGDSPYRLNISVSEDGSNGIVENMRGNHLATYDLNIANVYQVNGSYYNRLTRKCYFFVFSQPHDITSSDEYEYDNHLLCFDEKTEVITNIFTDTKNYFGLNLHYPVKDCDMLGDRLYFNPRISEPKMIDVVRAENYTNHVDYDALNDYLYGDKIRFFGGIFVANQAITGGNPSEAPLFWDRIGDCYQDITDLNFDSEFRYAFNVIRHIPVNRPICIYGTDEGKNSNNVRTKVFQFTHRYKFFDDTYSLFGAYSDVTLPVNDEYYNGEVPNAISDFNYIGVTVPLHSPSLVKEIDIVFREIEGTWKRAKLINRLEQELLDDVFYTYKFYNNDTTYEVVDEELFAEIYDSVPQKAATQELINKNILTYGGCTEGFNNIPKNEIDVILTPEIESLSVIESITEGGRRDCIANGDITTTYSSDYGANEVITVTINLGDWFPSGIIATDILRVTYNGVQVSYTIQAADILNIGAFELAIRNFLAANVTIPGTWDYGSGEITFNNYLNATEFIFYQPGSGTNLSLTKKKGWKIGAWHPMCLFYYDSAMRRWDAQTSKENIDGTGYSILGTTVYVPALSEISPSPSDTANRWIMNWEVNHEPPIEAKWWRWGYAGNSLCSWFVQYTINTLTNEPPWIAIDITPLQTLTDPTNAIWNEFPSSNISPYAFVKGDRVRIITEKSSASNMGLPVDTMLDFEIVKFDDTTNFIYVQDFDFNSYNIGADSLIEIYRPNRTTQKTVFYEFGELMPIIEDSGGNLAHGAGSIGTRSQDIGLGLSAIGVFPGGDIYHIVRTPSKPIDTVEGYFHESMWYSDFYDSDTWDKGRPGVETSFGQRTLNIERYSNQYLQDTGINGLSTFNADNYKPLSDIYGSIVASIEVGNTLKVYMEKKSASILVGRQEYTDSEGQTTLATSERVLGTIRYPEDNLGTQWVESVCKSNRYVYGFDVYNSTMWRDSANGIFPISGRFQSISGQAGDYKMEAWFKAKSDALIRSGIDHVTVMSCFDPKTECLFVFFRDLVNSDNDDTIVYHEPSDRWITFAEFNQAPIGGYNVMLELDYSILKGFENGIGYSFDEDTRFAVFNIPTTANNRSAYSGLLGLTVTALTPTVTCSAEIDAPKIDLQLIALTPTIVISFVHPSESTLTFASDDFGESREQPMTMLCSPNTCTILSISDGSWFSIKDNSGVPYAEGSTVYDNTVLWFYPNDGNSGAERTGIVAFRNEYNDTAYLYITQEVSLLPVVVNVLVSGYDTEFLSIAASGVILPGSSIASITFIPEHRDYESGETYEMRWLAGGASTGTGTFIATDSVLNSQYLYLNSAVVGGQVLYIYLSADMQNDKEISTDIAPITLTALTPTVLITQVAASVTSMTWLASEYNTGVALTSAITALGAHVKVDYIPSWISIRDAVGDPIIVTPYGIIEDGAVISIFPNVENLTVEREDTILLSNAYGDTATIEVYQAERTVPGVTVVTSELTLAANDPYLSLDGSTYATTDTGAVAVNFTADHPLYSDGEAMILYWKLYWNDVLNNSGNFVGFDNTYTEEYVHLVGGPPAAADTIRVEISSLYY